jgi:hypothetical protein
LLLKLDVIHHQTLKQQFSLIKFIYYNLINN